MTPRKRKSLPISTAIAASIKRHRTRVGWSQEDLANNMRVMGFTNWARTTVTEVEGSGRGRQVAVPELLGLAELFGVGLDSLLWDHPTQGTDQVPLEIVPGFVIDDWLHLLGLIMTPESLAQVVGRVAGQQLGQRMERMTDAYVNRVKELADELRTTASWIEGRANEGLTAIIESVTEDKKP